MRDSPIPSVVAFLVCERVIIEAQNNKKHVIGIFDNWQPNRLPGGLLPVGLYARITDAEGDYVFKVRLVQLESSSMIAELETKETSIPSRLGFHELCLALPPIPIPSPGTYEFQLFANDVYIKGTTLHVHPPSGG